MKNKSRKTLPRPTLHEGELVPINDPVIQEALDRMRRQAKPTVPAILREFAKQKPRKSK